MQGFSPLNLLCIILSASEKTQTFLDISVPFIFYFILKDLKRLVNALKTLKNGDPEAQAASGNLSQVRTLSFV